MNTDNPVEKTIEDIRLFLATFYDGKRTASSIKIAYRLKRAKMLKNKFKEDDIVVENDQSALPSPLYDIHKASLLQKFLDNSLDGNEYEYEPDKRLLDEFERSDKEALREVLKHWQNSLSI